MRKPKIFEIGNFGTKYNVTGTLKFENTLTKQMKKINP